MNYDDDKKNHIFNYMFFILEFIRRFLSLFALLNHVYEYKNKRLVVYT